MNHTKSLISKVFALSALAISLAFVPIGHEMLTSPIEETTYAWTGTQTPSVTDSYYSQASGLTGSALKSKLYTFNKPTNTSYSWSRYEAADEAYNDSSSVISIYTRHNILKSAHVGSYSWTTWNREHVYPQGNFPNSDTDNHNIFACEGQINNYRGNLKFGEVTHNSSNQLTVHGHLTDNYRANSLFEPCDEAKGEVARAVLYTSLYYNYTISSIFSSEAVCLKWHAQFPVTQREIYRNNRVHTLQGNRNPFVDHPSYANSIYNPSTPYTEADPLGGTPVTAPNTITLSPSTPTIAISQSVTLNVAVDTGSSSVNWTSSNNSIATVANGVVTGVAVGTATITATSTLNSEVTGTATVTVTSVPVTGVSLNKNTLSLPVETSETLVATITPSNATNKNVTWSSNNTSVATVNSSGAVSALAAGNATITVTTVDGSFTANCAVTVQPASLETVYVTSVELNKNSLSLEAEKNETLTVTINPTNATNKNVTWSSNKPAFVSVSSTGVVTAIEVGIAIITVTTEDGSFTDTCEVTVTAKTITPNGNGGCGGSIAITSGLIAALSAVGIAAILIKKKKFSKQKSLIKTSSLNNIETKRMLKVVSVFYFSDTPKAFFCFHYQYY